MNLAVVGCGGYAGYLIERLFDLEEICRVVAVTTGCPESETATELRGKGVAIHGNLDELLDSVTPASCQAVVIPTSIESHFEYTRKAVDKGFHVLLEKPPVATIQDLDRLISLQHESGRFIAVNFQHLFSPMSQMLKRRLATGELGKIVAVRASALWSRSESYFERSNWSGRMMLDGRWVLDGTIGNPLAHLLAEALYLATPDAGLAIPKNLTAELYRVNDIESEDTSCLKMTTENGVHVSYYAALSSEDAGPVCCAIETDRAIILLKNYCEIEIRWCDGRREADRAEDNVHSDRLAMLRSFIGSLMIEEKPLITVEECRPYMLAWNGAFESSGVPCFIGEENIARIETAEGGLRAIPELSQLFAQAQNAQCLFSDLDVEWSTPTYSVDLSQYVFFPSVHPELVSAQQNSLDR